MPVQLWRRSATGTSFVSRVLGRPTTDTDDDTGISTAAVMRNNRDVVSVGF